MVVDNVVVADGDEATAVADDFDFTFALGAKDSHWSPFEVRSVKIIS